MRQRGEVACRDRLTSGQVVLLVGEWFEGERQRAIFVLSHSMVTDWRQPLKGRHQ